jgi:acylphosphatase
VAAFRFHVTGRVQGVGYRYYVMREADTLGVTGFARNLPDGSVEIVAEGDDGVLADFEGRLRKGPSFARVSNVDRAAIPPRGDSGFHIR